MPRFLRSLAIHNRLLRISLVFALLMAAWHVTQHEIDIAGSVEAHEECQVCRLSYTPVTNVDVSSILPSLLVLIGLVLPQLIQFVSFYTQQNHFARAPPLN